MKKIFLSLALVVLSVSAFAQLSATAISGSDGYFVGKASYDLSFIPGLTIAPNVSLVQYDGIADMYRFGLNVEAKVPLWDAVRVGARGGYTPKRNSYSNYFYEGYAKVNLESLLFHVVELDNLTLGAGLRQTEHKFYASPDYKLGETDGYVSLGATKGGFDGNVTYTKALHFSDTRQYPPYLLDVPGLTAVMVKPAGFLQYALNANLGYTYKIVRPYASYTYLKIYDMTATDNLAAGITAKVGIVAVNASVEWLDISNRNNERQTFYSINGGISF